MKLFLIRFQDELLEQAKTTEKCMNPEDGVLNTFKSMLNLKYEKSTKEVKVIDILPDLVYNRHFDVQS